MNCKPGDLAIVVSSRYEHGRKYLGAIVEILHAVPPYRFQAPDGVWHQGGESANWVVKSCGAPFEVPCGGSFVKSMFASGADHCMRPIRGVQVENVRHDEVMA